MSTAVRDEWIRGLSDPVLLIVAGTRFGVSESYVWRLLDRYAERVARPNLVIHGACSGVDSFADSWAKSRGILVDPHPARWQKVPGGKIDRSQGPRRNSKMAALGTHCLVIRYSDSKGSLDMEKKARARGLVVHTVLLKDRP